MHIGHLTLHARRDCAPAMRTRLERALAVGEPSTRRLVLVRKIALGRLAISGPATTLERQVSGTLEGICAEAVHGRSNGAGSANAVWFQSHADAVALFWDMLLSGRRPRAWFWRLIMPRWRDSQPSHWLAHELAQIWQDPSARMALARAVVRAARSGQIAHVVSLFEQTANPILPLPENKPPETGFANSNKRFSADQQGARTPKPIESIRPAPRLAFFPVSGATRLLIAEAVKRGGQERALVIAALALSGERPDWAATPLKLAAKAGEAVKLIAEAKSGQMVDHRGAAPQTTIEMPVERHRFGKSNKVRDGGAAPIGKSSSDTGEHAPSAPGSGQDPSPASLLSSELEFAKAGLFLTLPLLNRLGLQDVIEQGGLSERHNFAAHLLVKMALSFGRADGSAMIDWLGVDPDDCARAQSELAAPLALWARIADKALRAMTTRRLHDLAMRKGWIIRDDETLDIRFPLASADIALRRKALDVDPGWVPWLGRVVHFHFSDAPMDSAP